MRNNLSMHSYVGVVEYDLHKTQRHRKNKENCLQRKFAIIRMKVCRDDKIERLALEFRAF